MYTYVCEQRPGANSSPTVTKLRQSYPWSRVIQEISSRTDRHTQTDKITHRHAHYNTLQPLPQVK